jgi:hypothetical protein
MFTLLLQHVRGNRDNWSVSGTLFGVRLKRTCAVTLEEAHAGLHYTIIYSGSSNVKIQCERSQYLNNRCLVYKDIGGTRYRSWLRHYTTSRKVAGSSPDGFF